MSGVIPPEPILTRITLRVGEPLLGYATSNAFVHVPTAQSRVAKSGASVISQEMGALTEKVIAHFGLNTKLVHRIDFGTLLTLALQGSLLDDIAEMSSLQYVLRVLSAGTGEAHLVLPACIAVPLLNSFAALPSRPTSLSGGSPDTMPTWHLLPGRAPWPFACPPFCHPMAFDAHLFLLFSLSLF